MSEQGVVFVVDDDPSVRKALKRLFQPTEFQIHTFESAEEFLEFPHPNTPSCLVLDVRMPGLSGIELQEHLISHHADLPIVFMTGHGDIPSAVKTIKAGAVDFLPKPVDKQRLRQTVAEAIALHASKRRESAQLAEFRTRVESLTPREREVLSLVVAGKLNKQIAKRLGISEATVKLHRGKVMAKTGMESSADLVRLSERAGLTRD